MLEPHGENERVGGSGTPMAVIIVERPNMASGATVRRQRGRFVPAKLVRSAINEATGEFGRGGVSHAQYASAKAPPAQPKVC